MGNCQAKLNNRIAAEFKPSAILRKEVLSPNLQYRQSNGGCQVQGNGALVLTDRVLWFTPLARCKGCCCEMQDIEIPVHSIKSASTVQDRRTNRICLCIDCGNDVLHIYVADVNGWIAAVDGLIRDLPLAYEA